MRDSEHGGLALKPRSGPLTDTPVYAVIESGQPINLTVTQAPTISVLVQPVGAPGAPGTEGPPGPQGPRGHEGPPGSGEGDLHFVFNQGVPASVWGPIKHGLGKYPDVVVFDSANEQVEGEVNHLSVNELTVTFPSGAFSGVAYCN